MGRYRKKPVEVNAEQFFFNQRHPEGVFFEHDHIFGQVPRIETLEGILRVKEGDWIITGVEGERYPCKPDIFEKTYEVVKDGKGKEEI